MLNKILMPSGGQTTDELVILQWEKKVGDHVQQGDILFEIETDKANLAVESYAEGTLLKILHGEGARVTVGETVAYIGLPTDKVPENDEGGDAVPPSVADNVPASVPQSAEERKTDDRIYASPLAKRKARIENIDLSDVARFVSRKLIRKGDIDSYLEDLRKHGREDEVYFVEATPMRRTIGRRMAESLSISPHYVVSADVDMTDATALRKKMNGAGEMRVRISFNDLIMKAVAKAVPVHPLVNASFETNRIRVHKAVHFGLAVAVENGLYVPVIRNVHQKTLAEIAEVQQQVIENVRRGNIRDQDFTGSTITLSNLGMFGIKEFSAIINQPESCILAVGAIRETPVAVDRQVVVRDVMNITASFDHRVVDGAVGAAFLSDVKKYLEHPDELMR